MGKRPLTDDELVSINTALSNGQLDPTSLSPEKKASLKSQWSNYKLKQDAAKDVMSIGSAALQAGKETMMQDLPVAGKAVQYLRKGAAEDVAEKVGKVAGQTAGSIAGGVTAATVGSLGEMLPRKGYELALAGVPTLSRALGVTGFIEKEAIPKISSFLTNIETPIVKRFIARASELGNKELLNPQIMEDAIAGLKNGVLKARSALGKKLESIENRVISKYPGKTIPVNDIGTGLDKALARKGFGGSGDVARELKTRVSDIVNDFKNVKPGFDELGVPSKAASDMSIQDALTLRRKIDDTVEWAAQGKLEIQPEVDALLKNARFKLNDRIKKIDPNLKKAQEAFSGAAQNFDKLNADILNGKDETIQKRITNLFNKDSIERKILSRLDSSTEGASRSLDTILDSITAQKFNPKLNPTVTRAASHTGGGMVERLGSAAAGYGAFAAPGQLTTKAAVGAGVLAATSPRLNALALRSMYQPIVAGQAPGLSNAAIAALIAARRQGQNGQP